ncbi:MAG: DUF4440 domain-containing protein [Actinomycetota bacterium]|nr:DUF4440 domain-containing protein [Actinomycetota bacterium]MDQ3679460.1 DUF4440 domain-containing protein [Actinomycetota bacterium]
MQAAIDASDADLFNLAFAQDVLWGSPFGAIVGGYDEIHSIHSKMFAAASARQAQTHGGGSRYEIEYARVVAEDVAIAYVRRFSLAEQAEEEPGRADAFDELALFVLVRRDGTWWLAAGLHTPDRRDLYRLRRRPSRPRAGRAPGLISRGIPGHVLPHAPALIVSKRGLGVMSWDEDQDTVPTGTIHSTGWCVSSAITSKSWS